MSFGLGLGFPRNRPFAGGPSLNFQFAGSTTLDPLITFSRGTNATLFDSSGTLVWAPNNAIRNNTMVGAVAGTPGTLPTNWARFVSGTGATAVIGTGTESGIAYIDIAFSGGNTDGISFFIDGTTGHAALNGQTWTGSAYYKLIAGSFANCIINHVVYEANSSGTALASAPTSLAAVTTAGLASQRITATRTNNNASTAEEQLAIVIVGTGAFSFTLRIGMPQLERGSVATAVNATSGTAYFGPRLDYDPSTLAARGLLIEEQRTNSIRNNTMQGAVAGTPGTLPTNWQTIVYGTGNSLTTSVIGTGTENGISYVDVRINGTSGTGARVQWYFEPYTSVAASTGQIWTVSSYASLVSGSWTNVTSYGQRIDEFTSGGSYITGGDNSAAVFPAIGLLRTNRNAFTRTLNGGATTAFVWPSIIIYLNNSSAIDFTLRIGLPQLEQGAFATSVIPTTTTALTRNADAANMNTLPLWYNATVSTLYTEFSSPVPTAVTASAVIAGYDDGTANNRFSNFYTSNTGAVAANQITGGAGNFTITAATGLTLSSVQKQATRYQAGSYASSANGAAVVTDSFASAPPTVNTLRFGLRPSGTQANMWLRRVTVYPRGLSNAELVSITS